MSTQFKRIDAVNPATQKQFTLIRAVALNPAQMNVVTKIREFLGGDPIQAHKDIRRANKELFGHEYMPYYMGKNVQCKVKNSPGMYNLGIFKLAAAFSGAEESTEVTTTPKPKKETKPKREAKAQKGKSKKAPKEIAAPATPEANAE
jgi:hypothetical protein